MADEGKWVTIHGRRVFIGDGEDLETAMKKSGKFDNKQSKATPKTGSKAHYAKLKEWEHKLEHAETTEDIDRLQDDINDYTRDVLNKDRTLDDRDRNHLESRYRDTYDATRKKLAKIEGADGLDEGKSNASKGKVEKGKGATKELHVTTKKRAADRDLERQEEGGRPEYGTTGKPEKGGGKKEASLEEKKEYLRKNNLTHLAKELNSEGNNTEGAINYVYDQHTLSKEQFAKKYGLDKAVKKTKAATFKNDPGKKVDTDKAREQELKNKIDTYSATSGEKAEYKALLSKKNATVAYKETDLGANARMGAERTAARRVTRDAEAKDRYGKDWQGLTDKQKQAIDIMLQKNHPDWY